MLRLLLAATCALVALRGVDAGARNNKQLFGDDDERLDWFEEKDERLQELALATMSMFKKNQFVEVPGSRPPMLEYLEIDAFTRVANVPSAADTSVWLPSLPLCEGEKFVGQPIAGLCSGFLVEDDIVVASGHCQAQIACDQQWAAWTFDFKATGPDRGDLPSRFVPASAVYYCKEVLSLRYKDEYPVSERAFQDHTVFRLDRVVYPRRPLLQLSAERPVPGTPIAVIGHPQGLPTKIARGVVKRQLQTETTFRHDADTFGGNSGSMIVSLDTYEVIGVLALVDYGYVERAGDGCAVARRCSADRGCISGFNVGTNAGNFIDSLPQRGRAVHSDATAQPPPPPVRVPTGTVPSTTTPVAAVEVPTEPTFDEPSGLPVCMSVTAAGNEFVNQVYRLTTLSGTANLQRFAASYEGVPNFAVRLSVTPSATASTGGGDSLEWLLTFDELLLYRSDAQFDVDAAWTSAGMYGPVPMPVVRHIACPFVVDPPVIGTPDDAEDAAVAPVVTTPVPTSMPTPELTPEATTPMEATPEPVPTPAPLPVPTPEVLPAPEPEPTPQTQPVPPAPQVSPSPSPSPTPTPPPELPPPPPPLPVAVVSLIDTWLATLPTCVRVQGTGIDSLTGGFVRVDPADNNPRLAMYKPMDLFFSGDVDALASPATPRIIYFTPGAEKYANRWYLQRDEYDTNSFQSVAPVTPATPVSLVETEFETYGVGVVEINCLTGLAVTV
jgi:V8-like Glu-specific endopeptidase